MSSLKGKRRRRAAEHSLRAEPQLTQERGLLSGPKKGTLGGSLGLICELNQTALLLCAVDAKC